VIPDTGADTRRMVVLHLTIILGFALTIAGGAAHAVVFAALRTVADLGVPASGGSWWARERSPGDDRGPRR
jgi:hypothetical protein